MGETDMTFEDFMKLVDEVLVKKFGVGYEDLEDYDWYEFFDHKCPPDEAVETFMEEKYSPYLIKSNF